MAKYEILDSKGSVINTIEADEAFVEEFYSGHYRLIPAPAADFTGINEATAVGLLASTDWVNQPDVIDPARDPHLLNQAAFLDYRELVRRIAVAPPTTEVTDWPVLPVAQWGS